jgi:spore maturation protein CgeB
VRFVVFTHSLRSDWNHGKAHFLRGVLSELQARGHAVSAFEAEGSWSARKLSEERGASALGDFSRRWPGLPVRVYGPAPLDLDNALDGVDVVLVHEWNEPELVRRVGEVRARGGGFRLFFHDTHHRAVTAPEQMQQYDLRHYDGVLAFGEVLRGLYLERGWAADAWTWHEAADVRRFQPIPSVVPDADLTWVGNWGDGERTAGLHEFLLDPARALGLSGTVHGVRYPEEGRAAVESSGLAYGGYLPNADVPAVFARHRVTVHVPRRPYARALPGIPTIRPFEALACGIPLVSAPWEDAEGLFTPGRDFLVARDGRQMQRHLRDVLGDPGLREALVESGLRTVHARHTCGHRVDELLALCARLDGAARARAVGR